MTGQRVGGGITVVVPTHPPRMANGMLARAVESVALQTLQPAALHVENDTAGFGAAATRNEGAFKVMTGWTAFLDSDDWLYPVHLETLARAQAETRADYLFSYFTVHDEWEAADVAADPLGLFGRAFDPAAPTQTTITILVRTELVHDLGGFNEQPADRRIDGTGLRYGEDYDFTVRAAAAGASIVHVPARTWAWRIHRGNTAGLPGTGDAAPAPRPVETLTPL